VLKTNQKTTQGCAFLRDTLPVDRGLEIKPGGLKWAGLVTLN